MAKGSKISRIREYFRTADADEAEVVLSLVNKDFAERTRPKQDAPPFTRQRRTKRVKKSNAEPAEHHIGEIPSASEASASEASASEASA